MAEDCPFTITIAIDRPVEVVWQALTQKSDVDQYYLAPLGEDITASGHELYYGTNTQKMIIGEVIAFHPPDELIHTFRFADSEESGNSLVSYRLKSAGHATELTLEHSGFLSDSQSYADIAMGWPIILEGLKKYLESVH